MWGWESFAEGEMGTPGKKKVDHKIQRKMRTVESLRGGRTYSGEGLLGGGGGVTFLGVGLLGRGQVCTSGTGFTHILGSGGRRVGEAWQGSG